MSSVIEVRGNLLRDPERKVVKIGNEDRTIAELTVMSNFSRKNPKTGEWEQVDEKSFPVQVTVWQEWLVGQVGLLKKGAGIIAKGTMTIYPSTDEQGRAYANVKCDADEVHLTLGRVESVHYKAKETPPA